MCSLKWVAYDYSMFSLTTTYKKINGKGRKIKYMDKVNLVFDSL